MIDYTPIANPSEQMEAIIALYRDAQWQNYLKDLDSLKQGLNCSLEILGAFDNGKLIGLIRVVGDGHTIVYIQDLIVLKEYHNHGIGSRLLSLTMEKYRQVRQLLLLTDQDPKLRGFYQKCGLTDTGELGLLCFVRK